jgi:hypothetical protein
MPSGPERPADPLCVGRTRPRCSGNIAMIANRHFRRPPAMPTLHRGGHAPARPRKTELHAENRGGIDHYADRLVCRPGRASGDHLWPPDRLNRADRLEPALTFIQRRSEMKALSCGATALALVAAVSLSPAMAQGPKPSGGSTWPGISQRVVPSSSTAEECRSGGLWVSPGYASGGKWRPAHCASNTQISAETGPKSSYGYTKTFKGPPPSGGQR